MSLPNSTLELSNKQFRNSRSSRNALRLALRVDGSSMPVWAEAVLADLLLADYVDIVDVRVACQSGMPWRLGALISARGLLRLVDLLYKICHDPLRRRRVPPSLLDRQEAGPVDVALDLTLGSSSWDREARHGVWSLQVGERVPGAAWPPFLLEMYRADDHRAVDLVRRASPDSPPELLCHASFPGNPFPSLRSNMVGPMWGACHFFIRKLNELHRLGKVTPLVTAAEDTQMAVRAVEPNLVDLIRWIVRQAARRIFAWCWRPARKQQWRVAIRRSEIPLPFESPDKALEEFRWMGDGETGNAADPFLFEYEGRIWLFFEAIDERNGHGHIACGWIDEGGLLRDRRSVLSLQTHLSYPQLLRQGDGIYMLPESAKSGGLDLYRARRFPDEWERVGRILDFPCVDSTVFRLDGVWWMFTSPKAPGLSVALTWLYRAERLEGPWQLQDTEPVATSAVNARSAGEIVAARNRLLRPAQDCSRSYGSALVFNEILELGPDRYAERIHSRVDAKSLPYMIGLHTYNRCGDWEVIDGLFA